jgi:hypothetical protein
MGRRAAELAGVLVASLLTSFVTGLATTGTDEPVLYIVGALVPLGLLLAYWLWIEPRAEANRVRAIRLHMAIDDAFELTQPQTDAGLPREGARRDFYDRLELSDVFEPNHVEASSALGQAFDAGQALLRRLDDEPEPNPSLIADLEAWQDRTAFIVEITRGSSDAMAFRMPTGGSTVLPSSERLEGLGLQVQLLEVWTGEERKRAGERAKDRYR